MGVPGFRLIFGDGYVGIYIIIYFECDELGMRQ